MLGCHRDVAILNEDPNCSEFGVLSKKVSGNKLCVPNQIEMIHDWKMFMVDRLIKSYLDCTYPIRRRLDINALVSGELKARYSITDYITKLDNLHILALIRSPEDVIRSIKARGLQGEKAARYRWRRATEILYELYLTEDLVGRLAFIHFDRLVSDPEVVMGKIMSRLDLEHDEAVMRGYLHTPQYHGYDKIDSSKKGWGLDSDLQHSLLRTDKELSRKYECLLRESL